MYYDTDSIVDANNFRTLFPSCCLFFIESDSSNCDTSFVGRYPRSKLGTARVVNRAVIRGTDVRWTGMRT